MKVANGRKKIVIEKKDMQDIKNCIETAKDLKDSIVKSTGVTPLTIGTDEVFYLMLSIYEYYYNHNDNFEEDAEIFFDDLGCDVEVAEDYDC